MVKESQERLRMLPATNKIMGSTNANTFRIRKCVVKIKRVKLQLNNIVKWKTAMPNSSRRCRVLIKDVNKTHLNAQPSKSILTTVRGNSRDVSVFEPDHNSTMCIAKKPTAVTPCKVRLKRIGTVQPAKKQTEEQILGDKENVTSKPANRFFHRDQPPTRTRSSVMRNVYDFLSESQIDDSALNQRKDPAADIIKQMIEEGRACAITRKMGKSRKRRERKNKVRPVGRRKQLSLKNKTETDQAELPPYFDKPLSPIYDLEKDSDDDDNHLNEPVVHEEAVQVHTPPRNMSPNPHKTMLEGIYSPLARSLLQTNQTKAQNPQYTIERRRELLNVARKYFSTPLNRKSPMARDNSTTLSATMQHRGNRPPVVLSPNGGGSSPWRVPDEAPMPNTFVFGFNTSQLPSYSSDHMRRSHVYVPDEALSVTEPMQNNNESICPALDDQSNGSAANDSNGENVPPPIETLSAPANQCLDKTVTPNTFSGQENENEENFVQLPNPRRTLQQRTPLKDINILDVVILPSWKNKLQQPKTPIKEKLTRNHVHFRDSVENTNNKSPQQQVINQNVRQQQSPRNLFGFEEFLTNDEQECGSVSRNQDITLSEKLQRLKGLRPTERELPQVSKAAMRYDFDDLTARTPKQRNIREMFCSTMVATPPPALAGAGDESTDLFKDMDPEVTFDEKKPRRTYVRERPKRKRKRVHVLFVESDSSGSEDNEQDSNDKSADSPGKAAPVKKRARRDVEHESKLKQFITSFNQECKEVENYSLHVE